MHPAQVLAVGYLVVILVGTILLHLPIATNNPGSLPWLDCLFTATSATAVTGLIVVNTSSAFTSFGQVVIMLLIQFGGLGLMTMSTLLALVIGRRIGLQERVVMQKELGQFQLSGLVKVVKRVLLITAIIEGLGVVILFLRWQPLLGAKKALYYAVFHSVSAFCNAGFDLFGNSMQNFSQDFITLFTISSLLILGGLGFGVVTDLFHLPKNKRLTFHSRMVLRVSLILLVLGWAFVFFTEYSNPETLGELSFGGKVLSAYFTSATTRTAGFESLPTGSLRTPTLFFAIVLMFIGASPASTGGGIKTTTFGVVVVTVFSIIRGKGETEVFQRRVAKETIIDALCIITLAMMLVFLDTIVLSFLETDKEFLDLFFETVSAFGTVGLSTGITPDLSTISKIMLILTMYAGRVGPMTVLVALSKKRKTQNFRYPEEKILVG
ncbi:MAG TPA: Trk family potassium uptake protein [Firmicutes bacterium]|nr:Trk family potassium uptake protein [Bacillota bacterium]